MLLQSSQLVLDTVHQLLVTTLKQLETELFMNIEVALRFFYMMGEVLPDKVIVIFLCCMLSCLCSQGCHFSGPASSSSPCYLMMNAVSDTYILQYD